jgi:hypothetical protein
VEFVGSGEYLYGGGHGLAEIGRCDDLDVGTEP